jgi:hypothetical protein
MKFCWNLTFGEFTATHTSYKAMAWKIRREAQRKKIREESKWIAEVVIDNNSS